MRTSPPFGALRSPTLDRAFRYADRGHLIAVVIGKQWADGGAIASRCVVRDQFSAAACVLSMGSLRGVAAQPDISWPTGSRLTCAASRYRRRPQLLAGSIIAYSDAACRWRFSDAYVMIRAMGKGRSTVQYPTPAIIGVAGLVVATWWLLRAGNREGYTVEVLGFTVAVLGLGIQVRGVGARKVAKTHAELVAASRDLARRVYSREIAEQHKFLADTGVSRPANVAFAQPQLLYWRSDGGGSGGTLREIAAYFAGLRHRRLLILGGAGAGKTVLANQSYST